MKKLSKLKLNALSEANIRDREMNRLTGGVRYCTCSCYYANEGYSSTDNQNANYNLGDNGGESTNGCQQYLQVEGITSYCPSCDESNTTGLYYPY